jgi:DNA-binding transcriptional MocR family regulator
MEGWCDPAALDFASASISLRINRDFRGSIAWGMSVWPTLPHGLDALSVGDELFKQGHLLAPGNLFSWAPSAASNMRFNVSRTLDTPALPALRRLIEERAAKV